MTQKKQSSFRFIWGVFMVIAYLGIAYLVVFTPILLRYNEGANRAGGDENFIMRLALGVVLLAYGLFRGYRMWKIRA